MFRANLGLKDAVLRGEFGVGGILDLRGSPLIGPPSAIYGKGTVFGFCDGQSIGLPAHLYVTLILNGTWENVTGSTGVNRVAIAGGTIFIQQALPNDTWSDWVPGWNAISLPNPVTTDTNQTITARKQFLRAGDAFGITAPPNTASYILANASDGTNRWFLGVGADNNETVALYNYRVGSGLNLRADGNIELSTPTRVTSNGVNLMLVGEYGFGGDAGNISVNGDEFLAILKSGVGRMLRNNLSTAWQDEYASGILTATQDSWAYFSASPFGGSVDVACGVQNGPAYKHRLWTNRNTTVDANGFLKTASPIVKLFADGTSELNTESEGVVTERVSTGVYKISGCLGFNSDPLWGGIDGGVEIPLDINKQPLIWVKTSVEEDGSIIIETYHRTHSDSPKFAQNNIEGAESGQPIDIPAGRWIDVRVQMPQLVIPIPTVLHSNVYCGSVRPAGDIVLQ
ncbi:hypothetical protein [Pectobacterium polonicum]|uniref:phage tail fiber protein n=1 Tax=Pectobacterium polonicum TaxID=2485124 RepID=UPI002B244EB4|nr:hypothetical protein [Pectobacterium polonicum]